MYCPSCGQQQASKEIKYCSRCGFQMGLIPELLANGGMLPKLAELYNKPKTFWTRKNGIRISILWICLCWFLLLPLSDILHIRDLEEVFALGGFGGGVIGILLSVFFLPSTKPLSSQAGQMPAQTGASHNISPGQLPPQQSIPAEQYIQPEHWKAPDTGQFVQPGSVTDSTTKLLQRDTK